MSSKTFIELLNHLLEIDDLSELRESVGDIEANLSDITYNEFADFEREFLLSELEQITESQTTGRAKYYIHRLIKSMTEVKSTEINDLNLRRWKEYDDILTDSLWIIEKRDHSGGHNGGYWGNFIPQIPNQLLRRYSKKNEWVLDTFLGSGTTLIECRRLNRNGIGIELQQNIAEMAKKNISNNNEGLNQKTYIVTGDSTALNYKDILKSKDIDSIQFALLHPPYWDIIKFSNDARDLSNSCDINEFLGRLGKIIDNTYEVLDNERYMAVVIGDKYSAGEWIPLGFYVMQEVLKRKFLLKSIVVKNFEQTRGKQSSKELWRYRALKGGFYVFKHEYIFLFKKAAI